MYVATKYKATWKAAKLRVQAVSNPVPAFQPEPVQVTSSVKTKRDEVVTQVVTLDSDSDYEIEHWMHLPIQVPTEVIDSDDSDGEDTSTNEMSKKIRTIDPMT